MTAPPQPQPAPSSPPLDVTQDKFSYEKVTVGGLTVLTLHGTIDHGFDGRKLGQTVQTKKLVLDLREVRRFASWGMSEWMTLLRTTQKCDLYIIECSTYAVSQINLITGLLGHGKLVSFYASYRCADCNTETEAQFVIPTQRDVIRHLPGTNQDCSKCNGRSFLEEYPAAFFEAIAARPPFDIDDEVLAFLRTKYSYQLSPDLTRFRAYRQASKSYSYLKMTGSVSTLPPAQMVEASHGTTIIDLSEAVYDPTDMDAWRSYVETAMPKVTSLQLLSCPLGFLEFGVQTKDLHDKLKVRTFALSYPCLRCSRSTVGLVDVAEQLEDLVKGAAPTVRCGTCSSLIAAVLSPGEKSLLRALPARVHDVDLDKFVSKATRTPVDKLENALSLSPTKAKPAADQRLRLVAVALATLILGGLIVVGYGLWTQRDQKKEVATAPVAGSGETPPPAPAFVRPEWIVSDIPSSAFCHDMINRLMCIGVSAYRPTRDDGVAEANDAALEELVNLVSLKVSDPAFKDLVITAFSGQRAKALSDLQAADQDRKSDAYAKAHEAVTKSRKRIAEVLRTSGGTAAPSQRSDWYWEEYASASGGTEVLVFVRYDVTLDAVKALVTKYSEPTMLLGSTVTTAFPAMAWHHADFLGGAVIVKAGGPLAEAQLAPGAMITAVGEHPVPDAGALGRRIQEWRAGTGNLKLTVKSGDEAPRVIEIPRKKVR